MKISTTELRKYLAEFLGTFTLVLVVVSSFAGEFAVSTAVLASLTLMLFVYTIGHISGSHINPAVTLGIFSLKKISLKEALSYLLAQLLGGATAFYLTKFLEVSSRVRFSSSNAALFGEFLGMILFTFGISAVVHGHVSKSFNGVVVGGSLLLGIAVASLLGAGAFLNPAVMLGLGVSTPLYVLAQLLGGVGGFQIYRLLLDKK